MLIEIVKLKNFSTELYLGNKSVEQLMESHKNQSDFIRLIYTNMLLKCENPLLQSHRQRETTGIKKLYNSFFVMF